MPPPHQDQIKGSGGNARGTWPRAGPEPCCTVRSLHRRVALRVQPWVCFLLLLRIRLSGLSSVGRSDRHPAAMTGRRASSTRSRGVLESWAEPQACLAGVSHAWAVLPEGGLSLKALVTGSVRDSALWSCEPGRRTLHGHPMSRGQVVFPCRLGVHWCNLLVTVFFTLAHSCLHIRGSGCRDVCHSAEREHLPIPGPRGAGVSLGKRLGRQAQPHA